MSKTGAEIRDSDEIREPKPHLNLTYMLSQAYIAMIWKIYLSEE